MQNIFVSFCRTYPAPCEWPSLKYLLLSLEEHEICWSSAIEAFQSGKTPIPILWLHNMQFHIMEKPIIPFFPGSSIKHSASSKFAGTKISNSDTTDTVIQWYIDYETHLILIDPKKDDLILWFKVFKQPIGIGNYSHLNRAVVRSFIKVNRSTHQSIYDF